MGQDRSGRVRRFALKLAISLASTLAVVEVALRVWDATHERTPGLVAVRKYGGEPIYSPHPYLGYVLNPAHERNEVNTLGLRGPAIEPGRQPGVVRVLCLGGSTTYGAGLRAEQAYPMRLEQHLNAAAPDGLRFEVLNGGVPGYTSIDSLVNLELRLLALEPDVVLVYHGVNDARLVQARGYRSDYSHIRAPWRDPRDQVSPLDRWLVLRWRTWAWLTELTGRGFSAMSLENLVFVEGFTDRLLPPEPEVHRAGVEDFVRNLRNIVAVSRAAGAEAGLMTFATRRAEEDTEVALQPCINAMNAGILALAAEQDVPLFDVRAAIGGQWELYSDYVHCTADGCDRQARAIAETARAQGLWGLGPR
jgi:lysophospholipase L1-like esterase